MSKVKIFYNDTRSTLEKEINDFIKDKRVISVSFVSSEVKYHFRYECCVLYEE